jgi:hypothetical protein
MKTGIQIGGPRGTPFQQQLAKQLSVALGQAITLGREQTAVAIVSALRDLGSVTGTTIQNCTFQDR